MVVPILSYQNEAPKRASFDKKMREEGRRTAFRKGKKPTQNQTKTECR